MDIQLEKLHLIEQLTRIEDFAIIMKVKEILDKHNEKIAGTEPNGKLITQADLMTRAIASNEAIKKGKIISVESLEKESESW